MRGGDASRQMVSLAFTSGVSELGVMGEPEEIGVGEGGGVEGDVMNGQASQKKCGVVHLHERSRQFQKTLTLTQIKVPGKQMLPGELRYQP